LHRRRYFFSNNGREAAIFIDQEKLNGLHYGEDHRKISTYRRNRRRYCSQLGDGGVYHEMPVPLTVAYD
jgi:hypothetical protein